MQVSRQITVCVGSADSDTAIACRWFVLLQRVCPKLQDGSLDCLPTIFGRLNVNSLKLTI